MQSKMIYHEWILAGALVLITTVIGEPRQLAASTAQSTPAMAPMSGMTVAPMPGMTMEPPVSTVPMGPMGMASPRAVSTDRTTMHSTTDVADPMSEDGSGTSWAPRSTQMFGWMRMDDRNMQMTHGTLFPRYVSTGSDRAGRRADAPNWFMFMGTHAVSDRSQFGYTAMVSADFLTENETGYPLLFQTGESAYGRQLHDYQHPHDLFSELAVTYSARLGGASSIYGYIGYPGEPALGPPAFMHRRIAYDMPDSTVGHHWEDATHIQYGVATLGYATAANVKLEASAFSGREPNEVRTNFDPIHLDSYSSRVSWNPGDNVAAEVSYAFIKSPEALDPATNQHRFVASLLYNLPLGLARTVYLAAIYGQNFESDGSHTSSYLVEADVQSGSNAGYARAELGTRTARDLVIPNVPLDRVYAVGALTVGGVHDLTRNAAAVTIGVGAQLTVGSKSAGLDAVYGSGTPLGYELFFRIRPPDMAKSMNMARMSDMPMGGR